MQKLSLVLVAGIFAAACGSSTNIHDGTSTDSPATEPTGGTKDPGASTTTAAPTSTDAGSAAVDDDGGDPVDPAYATPVQCTSGTHWTSGDHGSDMMKPGSACRTCHAVGGQASSKSWDIAGTVYPTAHEPDDCNGVGGSGVTVVITDANGKDTALTVNSAGNFYHNDYFGFAGLAKPYHAKVVSGGKVRKMAAAQTDGNCNNCHTEAGANGAPGRIMAP